MPSFPGEGKLLLSYLLLFTSIIVSPFVDIPIIWIWTQTIYINFPVHIPSSVLTPALYSFLTSTSNLPSLFRVQLCYSWYNQLDFLLCFFFISWLLINKFPWVIWLFSDFLSSERKLFIHQNVMIVILSHNYCFFILQFLIWSHPPFLLYLIGFTYLMKQL